MNKKNTMNNKILVVVLALGFCGTAVAERAHWSYSGHGGPEHWAELEKDFGTCKLGNQQSPINIETKNTAKAPLPAIRTSYTASEAELVNNGHTIQINLSKGGSAALSNGDYELLQFHFHTPSEEKIDGKAYPLVAHFVHKNNADKLAVIAVMFKEGRENAALKDVFAKLPAKEAKEPLAEKFDATKLLPQSLGYFSFTGSLTTPPCSEGVSWHVLKAPVEMSKVQIAAFRKVFAMNARPVQPLNGRKVVATD